MSQTTLKVLVLHGPNLNLTGFREPDLYGKMPLEDIDAMMNQTADDLGLELRILQSNHEGVLIDTIQENRRWADAIVINPGALTHYSIALRDALVSVRIPIFEVHLSNTAAREEFRRHSVVSPIAVGCVQGFGGYSYVLALHAVKNLVQAVV